jgi:hypothetical protein
VDLLLLLTAEQTQTRDARVDPRRLAAMPALTPVAGRATAGQALASQGRGVCGPPPRVVLGRRGQPRRGDGGARRRPRPAEGGHRLAGMAAGRRGGRDGGRLPGSAAAGDLRDHLPELLAPATSPTCCCRPRLRPAAADDLPNLQLPGEVLLILRLFLLKIASSLLLN